MLKRGQVWIETVIYTLIAFILIGAVLGFAKPKIEEMQDKAYVDQSIELMKSLDETIGSVTGNVAGNKRKLEVSIKKGSLKINSKEDKIEFELTGRYLYSDVGEEISEGNLIIKTEKLGDLYTVKIKRAYNYDLTFNSEQKLKTISKASTPYNIFVENKGANEQSKTQVDVTIN